MYIGRLAPPLPAGEGAEAKDLIENRLLREMCAGTIPLQQAQHEIATQRIDVAKKGDKWVAEPPGKKVVAAAPTKAAAVQEDGRRRTERPRCCPSQDSQAGWQVPGRAHVSAEC
jgi:hypothetical protein